jgi:DNA-binding response OmpR family regulator
METAVDGKPVILPRRELLVLSALMKRIGRTVTREALANAVYSFDAEIQSNALDSHVSRLRKKLTELDAGVTIHTIRGIGYLLKAAE